MEVNGESTPQPLYPWGNSSTVYTEKGAGWTMEQVRTFWKKEINLLFLLEFEPQIAQMKPSHYTEYITPAPTNF